jgi:Uma2 family endonuclease
MASNPKQRLTPEEYLELERKAEFKSEYFFGKIYALDGASPEHSTITFNLAVEVGTQLRGTPCQGFSGDMKIRTGDSWLYAYPDLSIVCDEPLFHDEKGEVLINPKVIFEILSPSTEKFDRGAKFLHYQVMNTFTDYVLIAQDEPHVEHFTRQQNGWILYNIIRDLESKLSISSIDCTISLAGLYDRIKFPEETLS